MFQTVRYDILTESDCFLVVNESRWTDNELGSRVLSAVTYAKATLEEEYRMPGSGGHASSITTKAFEYCVSRETSCMPSFLYHILTYSNPKI